MAEESHECNDEFTSLTSTLSAHIATTVVGSRHLEVGLQAISVALVMFKLLQPGFWFFFLIISVSGEDNMAVCRTCSTRGLRKMLLEPWNIKSSIFAHHTVACLTLRCA